MYVSKRKINYGLIFGYSLIVGGSFIMAYVFGVFNLI